MVNPVRKPPVKRGIMAPWVCCGAHAAMTLGDGQLEKKQRHSSAIGYTGDRLETLICDLRMYVCMYVCMYVSIYIYVYLNISIYIYIYIYIYISPLPYDVFTVHDISIQTMI